MSNVVVRSVVEFFTLKEAAAQAARLDEVGRKRVLDRAGLAKQRADAAESLWAAGHPAEALRLAVDALHKTREASEAWLEATGQGPVPPAPASVAAQPDAKAPEAEATSADDGASAVDASASEGGASAPEGAAEASNQDAKASEDAPGALDDTPEASGHDTNVAEREAKAPDQDTSTAEDDAKAEAGAAKAGAPPAESSLAPRDASPTGTAVAPASALARFLAARGAGSSAVTRLGAIEAELARTALPLLDVEVQPAHGDLFDRLTDLRTTVARSLAEVTLLPRELTFRRLGRIATVVVVSLVTVVGSYLALRTPEGVHARASAHFNELPDFEPSRVLDGNSDTSWLLPDRTAGWVEMTINPARNVSRIRLLNTHNTPYNDRATLEYRLVVFAHGVEARSIDGAFEFSASPAWVTHDLGGIEGVDRVRFEVRTWHQHGGGLAEIQVE